MRHASLTAWGKVGLLLLLPFALIFVPTAWLEGRRSLCLFRNLTGRPCPGCGMTRACSRAFHGDFKGAFRYNKRVVIVLPILAYTWVRALATEYRRLRPPANEAGMVSAHAAQANATRLKGGA